MQTLASLAIATSQAFSAEQSPTVSVLAAAWWATDALAARAKTSDLQKPFHVQQAGSACPPGSMVVANCRNGR